jgi:plasmid maintenance system killer protein
LPAPFTHASIDWYDESLTQEAKDAVCKEVVEVAEAAMTRVIGSLIEDTPAIRAAILMIFAALRAKYDLGDMIISGKQFRDGSTFYHGAKAFFANLYQQAEHKPYKDDFVNFIQSENFFFRVVDGENKKAKLIYSLASNILSRGMKIYRRFDKPIDGLFLGTVEGIKKLNTMKLRSVRADNIVDRVNSNPSRWFEQTKDKEQITEVEKLMGDAYDLLDVVYALLMDDFPSLTTPVEEALETEQDITSDLELPVVISDVEIEEPSEQTTEEIQTNQGAITLPLGAYLPAIHKTKQREKDLIKFFENGSTKGILEGHPEKLLRIRALLSNCQNLGELYAEAKKDAFAASYNIEEIKNYSKSLGDVISLRVNQRWRIVGRFEPFGKKDTQTGKRPNRFVIYEYSDHYYEIK